MDSLAIYQVMQFINWIIFKIESQWHAPKLFDRLKGDSKVKTTKEQEVGGHVH